MRYSNFTMIKEILAAKLLIRTSKELEMSDVKEKSSSPLTWTDVSLFRSHWTRLHPQGLPF